MEILCYKKGMSDFPRIQPIITEMLQAGKRYRLLRRNGNSTKNKTGTALKKGESRFKLDYENANQNISAKNYAFYPINGTRRRLSMGKQKVEEYYEPGSGRSDSTFGKVPNFRRHRMSRKKGRRGPNGSSA
jgi:hypothetical protein